MARLRAPDGCPWDREQTLESLRSYLIEEAYETLEAIDRADPAEHCAELGDVLLQIVFQAQLASEQGHFDSADVIDGICRKLLRRHPHVFGQASAETPADVVVHWERIKQEEKQSGVDAPTGAPASALDGVPAALPALLATQRLSDRAARVGFDWKQPDQVLAKVDEELAELHEALAAPAGPERSRQLAWELGDLFFALVNLARHLRLDAENTLREANQRFRNRFAHVEALAQARQIELSESSEDLLDELWQAAKRSTR